MAVSSLSWQKRRKRSWTTLVCSANATLNQRPSHAALCPSVRAPGGIHTSSSPAGPDGAVEMTDSSVAARRSVPKWKTSLNTVRNAWRSSSEGKASHSCRSYSRISACSNSGQSLRWGPLRAAKGGVPSAVVTAQCVHPRIHRVTLFRVTWRRRSLRRFSRSPKENRQSDMTSPQRRRRS